MKNILINQTAFYFIRHGKTESHGGDPNIRLNEKGIRQAITQQDFILRTGIKTVCCSPLIRAVETKDILVEKAPNIPVHIIPTLAECDAKVWHALVNQARSNSGEDLAYDFSNRITLGIQAALVHTAPVLIVGHGGTHYALCEWLNIENHPWIIDNCVPVLFKRSGNQWLAEFA